MQLLQQNICSEHRSSSVSYQLETEEEMKFNKLASLPVSSRHIVFDKVGAIICAVSYSHVIISVDFTSVLTACLQVQVALENYEDKVQLNLQQSLISSPELHKLSSQCFNVFTTNYSPKCSRLPEMQPKLQKPHTNQK